MAFHGDAAQGVGAFGDTFEDTKSQQTLLMLETRDSTNKASWNYMILTKGFRDFERKRMIK